MYSLLPAIVSGLFLGYGFYVLATRGFNRVSLSFFWLCLTTFFWQATWAVLYQVSDPAWAGVLVRLGYLLILFLPTSLYQFLVEIADRPAERRRVYLSYAVAAGLAVFVLFTDEVVAGTYPYFWGYYPKAGPLHPLHVLQTVAVVGRGLWITYDAARTATHDQRVRLRLCVASLFIYLFAAVDYLCNYGLEFYPPGVIFVAASLGLIMVAVTRYRLMSRTAMAATVAHEMRTPLASIRMRSELLLQWLPELEQGYRRARDHGLVPQSESTPDISQMAGLLRSITAQVDRSNVVIDMMLAAARAEEIDTSDFDRCRMTDCVRDAIDSYPFLRRDRQLVRCRLEADFEFMGTSSLMVYVVFNLLRNALHAIQVAGKGEIVIATRSETGVHLLSFTDTGTGIRASDLPRIFEPFFTTRKSGGAGIGLAFCRRVVEASGGRLDCQSVEGEYARFTMRFPALPPMA